MRAVQWRASHSKQAQAAPAAAPAAATIGTPPTPHPQGPATHQLLLVHAPPHPQGPQLDVGLLIRQPLRHLTRLSGLPGSAHASRQQHGRSPAGGSQGAAPLPAGSGMDTHQPRSVQRAAGQRTWCASTRPSVSSTTRRSASAGASRFSSRPARCRAPLMLVPPFMRTCDGGGGVGGCGSVQTDGSSSACHHCCSPCCCGCRCCCHHYHAALWAGLRGRPQPEPPGLGSPERPSCRQRRPDPPPPPGAPPP